MNIFYGLMMEGEFLHMNSTTQWSILWSIALLPPQEMLPPESFFRTTQCNNTASINSEHLFGFAPCIPPLTWDNSINTPHEQTTQGNDNVDDINEDFSALFGIEEFASFI